MLAFLFNYMLRPFLNMLSFVMKESRQERKLAELNASGGLLPEMVPQLKKHIAAEEIRDLLKLIVSQGNCNERFVISMDKDGSRVSLLSVTGQLLMRVYIYSNHFQLHLSVEDPGVRIESIDDVKKKMGQSMSNMVCWHNEIMEATSGH